MAYRKSHNTLGYKFFVFQLVSLFIISLYLLFHDSKVNTAKKAERVRIDSIIVKQKYSILPDKIWVHYTKYGPSLVTTNEKYKVGDSIDVKIIKVNE